MSERVIIPSEIAPPAAEGSAETIGSPAEVPDHAPALSGLRRIVDSLKGRLAGEPGESAEVHKKVAEVMIRRGDPKTGWSNVPLEQQPVTLSERRQALRAARRQAKALKKADHQFLIASTWDRSPYASDMTIAERREGNEFALIKAKLLPLEREKAVKARAPIGLNDNLVFYPAKKGDPENLGNPDYDTATKKSRLNPIERRRAFKANKKFNKLEAQKQKLAQKVVRSANGEDIPGRVLKRLKK